MHARFYPAKFRAKMIDKQALDFIWYQDSGGRREQNPLSRKAGDLPRIDHRIGDRPICISEDLRDNDDVAHGGCRATDGMSRPALIDDGPQKVPGYLRILAYTYTALMGV
jgi:hypothetical protein